MLAEMRDRFLKAVDKDERLIQFKDEISNLVNTPNLSNIEHVLQYLYETAASIKLDYRIPTVIQSDTAHRHILYLRNISIIAHEIRKHILQCVSRHKITSKYLEIVQWLPDNAALDIFSMNYDLVIEDLCRVLNIRCVDGFAGDGRWDNSLLSGDGRSIRLIKLHGSIDWVVDKESRTLRKADTPGSVRSLLKMGHAASATAETAMIWPAIYASPADLFGELRRAFEVRLLDMRMLLIIGYQCADMHILHSIADAASKNERLKIAIACGGNGAAVRDRIIQNHPVLNKRVVVVSRQCDRFPDLLRQKEYLMKLATSAQA